LILGFTLVILDIVVQPHLVVPQRLVF